MSVMRIRKRLVAPIPELPELAPMVGKTVEIIVVEEGSATAPWGGFWDGLTAEELLRAQGVEPLASVGQLAGAWLDDADDGFEEAFASWRDEAWRDSTR